MQGLSAQRITSLLDGPHEAVLSVSRHDKGPVAVPISYHHEGGRFYMVTSPESLHGRLMQKRGRATLTVQFDACDGRRVHQWYVMAEGPVRFADDDLLPHVRRIMAKDRGPANADEWTKPSAPDMAVAVLHAARISGYEFRDSLD